MKNAVISLWIATIIIIIFVGLTQRYSIVVAGGNLPVAYKLDKITGKVWFVNGRAGQTLVSVRAPKDVK
ncbi:MAG: hypothetical protein KAJ66_01140 [Candidatus Omnitrophica bacterium]|nr:hypothetical protein [Candidatus Omnitrophota bacterium]